MRYFLDTEYNGWRGELISLALVPEDGGQEFYITLDWEGPLEQWVQDNVLPYLDAVPETMVSTRLPTQEAARELSQWLTREQEAQFFAAHDNTVTMEIVADWPEDIMQMCSLLIVGPGVTVDVPPMMFRLVMLPNWSTAANSKVPHNALHDARALRDHILSME